MDQISKYCAQHTALLKLLIELDFFFYKKLTPAVSLVF